MDELELSEYYELMIEPSEEEMAERDEMADELAPVPFPRLLPFTRNPQPLRPAA